MQICLVVVVVLSWGRIFLELWKSDPGVKSLEYDFDQSGDFLFGLSLSGLRGEVSLECRFVVIVEVKSEENPLT